MVTCPESRISLSYNDNGDNEMKPRDVHRYPGIYITAEETLKPLR